MPSWARGVWLLCVAVALPAWVHWHYVVGRFDLASFSQMSPARFLGELALVALALFAVCVLPWSLWLGRRRRRHGPKRREAWIGAFAMAAALLLALHVNLAAYAPFYGNTWARWEPTFELVLPQWPWLLASVWLTVALELAVAARARKRLRQ